VQPVKVKPQLTEIVPGVPVGADQDDVGLDGVDGSSAVLVADVGDDEVDERRKSRRPDFIALSSGPSLVSRDELITIKSHDDSPAACP
jgi:hypothetical protein